MRLPGSILQGILARSALTLLRLYLGLVFLVLAGTNPQPGIAPQLAQLLQREGGQGRVALIAGLIFWGELLVGCCLLLGLGTRLAAALGFLLAVNFMLADGAWFWTPSSPYASWAIVCVALIIGAAGRTLGLDAFLARRWPRSPLW